jgi:hypothetical protein
MSALALCRVVLRLARVAVVASLIVIIATALLYQLLGSPLLHILYEPLPHAGEASIYVPGKSFPVVVMQSMLAFFRKPDFGSPSREFEKRFAANGAK